MTTEKFRCRWPKCQRKVEEGRWGCDEHRDRLPGGILEEIDMACTTDQKYEADKAAQEWIWSNT